MITENTIFDLVSHATAESLLAYIRSGRPTGGFLRAVLSNDLFGAVGAADSDNILLIPELCTWIYNEAPAACHGSPEKVEAWIKSKRLGA